MKSRPAGSVWVWCGTIAGEPDLADYACDSFGEDGGALPNPFMVDAGVDDYDPSFAEFATFAPSSIADALPGFSYVHQFGPALVQTAERLGLREVTSLFLLYDHRDPSSPTGRAGPTWRDSSPTAPPGAVSGRLTYLGQYEYRH